MSVGLLSSCEIAIGVIADYLRRMISSCPLVVLKRLSGIGRIFKVLSFLLFCVKGTFCSRKMINDMVDMP
jgi:hypothetical protein